MEEPEEISDLRGESLVDQISDKIHGSDDLSSYSGTDSEAKETRIPPLKTETQSIPQPQPPSLPPRPEAPPQRQPYYVRGKANRVFVREELPRKAFDGIKPADIIYWRNKKLSASLLSGATAIWIFFELLEYHLLTLVCHVIILGLGLLFFWSNTTTLINKRPPHFPEVRLPEGLFIDVAKALHNEINHAIAVLREIAAGRDLQQFLVVVGVMWVLSIVGSFINFLTLFYIAFVFLLTVPVLFEGYSNRINGFAQEAYSDRINEFAQKATDEIKKPYYIFDSRVLNRIPMVAWDKKND